MGELNFISLGICDEKDMSLKAIETARNCDILYWEHYTDYLDINEEVLLQSLQRPIVLCRKREDSSVSKEVSLDNDYYGIMLPYTPLHEVLFRKCNSQVLVMTSANMSEEPICYQNDECITRMGHVADYFLVNNRDIHTRCDDSVIRLYGNKSFFIRRSRGYVPKPILLPEKGAPVLEQPNVLVIIRLHYKTHGLTPFSFPECRKALAAGRSGPG